VGEQGVEVTGEFGKGIENGLASPVMEGVSTDPNGRAGLESRGSGFKLIRAQEDHSVRGPFPDPVGDFSMGLRGLVTKRVR
jgi:hypothetical protein